MSEISSQDLDAARDRLKASAEASEYLTVEEAAEIARCHPVTIRRAFESGRLRAFRPAQRVLIREDDLRAYIESKAAVPEPHERPTRPGRSRRPRPGSVASLRALEREAGR